MIRIMYSEVTIYPEKIRMVYNKYIDELRSTLAGYFKNLQDSGSLRKNVSPEIAARIFLWILLSYFRSEEIMRSGPGITRQKIEKNVGEIVDIFMLGTLDKGL